MKTRIPLVVALTAVACHNENTGTVAGPPLTIAPPDASPAASAASPAPEATAPEGSQAPQFQPIHAQFVDLTTAGTEVKFRACEQYFIGIARGKAQAAREELSQDDLLIAQGAGSFNLSGDGLAIVATVQPRNCEPRPKDAGATFAKRVVRASTAPELTWAGGAMHAHLDVESAISPLAYFGRLAGTAGVPEHMHEDAWEVLCAIEAAGTFTLAGKEQRLGAKQIVVVPPGTKHAWKPDPGSKLVAFQMYSPPGPEQRFKKLAAEGK